MELATANAAVLRNSRPTDALELDVREACGKARAARLPEDPGRTVVRGEKCARPQHPREEPKRKIIMRTRETWFREGGADGFSLSPNYLPGALDDFVDQVVPILQKRGLFRTDYEGATLRENLGLPRPVNAFVADPSLGVEPTMWAEG